MMERGSGHSGQGFLFHPVVTPFSLNARRKGNGTLGVGMQHYKTQNQLPLCPICGEEFASWRLESWRWLDIGRLGVADGDSTGRLRIPRPNLSLHVKPRANTSPPHNKRRTNNLDSHKRFFLTIVIWADFYDFLSCVFVSFGSSSLSDKERCYTDDSTLQCSHRKRRR